MSLLSDVFTRYFRAASYDNAPSRFPSLSISSALQKDSPLRPREKSQHHVHVKGLPKPPRTCDQLYLSSEINHILYQERFVHIVVTALY